MKKTAADGISTLSAGALSAVLWGGALFASPLAAQPAPAVPSERPRVAALAISEPIRVDGVLDDAAWQQAEVAGNFIQREPAAGQPAAEPTEIRVAYTHSTLYVAIRAMAAEPQDIVGEEMLRDGQLFRDDSVVILLDTFNDDRNAYFFETNPNGARTDALVTDEGRDFNVQWDGVWEVAAQRNDEGWAAEIAIPFTTLRFDPRAETWGFQVRRLIRHRSQEVYWAPLPREVDMFRISLAGDLTGIRGLEPGLNLRLKPFGVATSADTADPITNEDEDDLKAGLDLKWGLSRTLTLDLTYNTDFAESEVDDQQINLTRFSLFFPEKREFFLENAGIFEFGFNSPGTPLLKPFFSRRLGIGPTGTVVPIDWGARLTGRVGEWSLGVLDVQTGEETVAPGFEVPETNWGVVRLKRNVGQRSSLGLIATRRDGETGGTNEVLGLDATLRPTQNLSLDGFYTRSQDSAPANTANTADTDDWAGGGRVSWQGPVWNWAVDAIQIGELYNPEVGFLLRRGVRRYFPRFGYQPRPNIPGVRALNFGAAVDLYTDLDDNVQSRTISSDLFGVSFLSEDFIGLFGESFRERLPGPFEIVPGVVIPRGLYDFEDVGLRFDTNSSRRFAVTGSVLGGSFFDGDRVSSQINLGVRANRHLRTDTAWARDDISLPYGSFTSNIVRQRIGFSWTPNLSANTYIQYADQFDLFSLNLRINWIYRPGSDIFLVFNQNWNAPSLGNLSTQDRAVILKLTYLLQL